MTREYAKPVSRRQWQIGLFAFASTVIVGAALAVALLLGLAIPHPTSERVISSRDVYPIAGSSPVISSLKDVPLPMTLEMEAGLSGAPELSWGIWVGSGDAYYAFRIREDGYFNVSSGWQEFMHIRPDTNKLTLHIAPNDWQADFESDYNVTLRINDEIAWQGTIQSPLNVWGVDYPSSGTLDYKAIKIYTG